MASERKSAGSVDVLVTNPDGQAGNLAGGYTYAIPASYRAVIIMQSLRNSVVGETSLSTSRNTNTHVPHGPGGPGVPASCHVSFRKSCSAHRNGDTVVLVPLDGEVAESPGAALMKSNMLARRVGMALKSSAPKRVPNPGSRASMREPAPWTTIDSSTSANLRTAVLSMVEPTPIRISPS
jgi:hypothetical protein